MSPQPLSRVRSKAEVRFGPNTATTYPHLCSIAMEAITLGAQAEFNWSAILVDFLKADFTTGMAMYEALSGGEARRSALLGAAQSALDADDFLVLKAIDKALAPARRVRNDFVHHIWGRSKEVPDALLLIDPRCLRSYEVGIAVTNAEMNATRRVKLPPDIDRSLIAVWREKDLKQARDAMIEALDVLARLSIALSVARPAIQIAGRERQQLLNRPAIAQALQQMSPKKTPPAPHKPRGKKLLS